MYQEICLMWYICSWSRFTFAACSSDKTEATSLLFVTKMVLASKANCGTCAHCRKIGFDSRPLGILMILLILFLPSVNSVSQYWCVKVRVYCTVTKWCWMVHKKYSVVLPKGLLLRQLLLHVSCHLTGKGTDAWLGAQCLPDPVWCGPSESNLINVSY